MNKLYSVVVRLMNGTVTMGEEITNYETRELAEKVKAAVDKANEGSSDVYTFIQESVIYNSEKEIPILN